MAKDKFRSIESMGNIIKSRMDLMKVWDKKDALALMLPQRVEANMLYNFKNDVIGGCDGEDVIFHKDETIITETNRITDKFLNTFYAPMEAYFAGETKEDSEASEAAIGDGSEGTEKPKKEKLKKIGEDVVEASLVETIQTFIDNDDLKNAKKYLKENKDHDDFKKAKKLIKKAKGE